MQPTSHNATLRKVSGSDSSKLGRGHVPEWLSTDQLKRLFPLSMTIFCPVPTLKAF